MKILFVAGRHAYGNPARGASYEIQNMLPALEALGHSVTFFESFDRACHADFAALNRAFVAAVDRLRPDVIFCVLMGYEIWTETLDAVRLATNAIVVNWGTDDSWKYDQFSRFIAPHVDVYATTSMLAMARAQADGLRNFVQTQWAANDLALAPPLSAAECRYQVTFVGAAYGNRRRWIERLAQAGVAVECFGHGWPNGPVSSEDVRRILRESVVSLNFADSGLHWHGWLPYRSRQVKARAFEVPGAGGFLLTEHAAELARYYVDRAEIVMFRGIGELVESVRHFLADHEERDKIARAGFERTRSEHVYSERFTRLLEHAHTFGRSSPPSGVAAAIGIEAHARLHQPGPGLKGLRAALVGPARLFWGESRGPRAARRLLFELSWRLAGRRTYSVSGWPGRLFYRES